MLFPRSESVLFRLVRTFLDVLGRCSDYRWEWRPCLCRWRGLKTLQKKPLANLHTVQVPQIVQLFTAFSAQVHATPGSPSQVWRRIAKPACVGVEIRWALGPRGFKSHSRRQPVRTILSESATRHAFLKNC